MALLFLLFVLITLMMVRYHSAKALIYCNGNLRGGELTWLSLQRELMLPNSADLAILVDTKTSRDNLLFKMATYKWTYEEPDMNHYEEWYSLAEGTLLREDNSTLIDEYWRHAYAAKEMKSGIITYTLFAMFATKIKEYGLLDIYDRYIVTRSDQFYACPFDLNHFDVTKNVIWSAPGSEFGINDKWLLTGSRNILTLLNVLPSVVCIQKNDTHIRTARTEELLLKNLKKHSISVVKMNKRTWFTVKTLNDTTRFHANKGGQTLSNGLVLKYAQEYNLSMAYCKQNMTYDALSNLTLLMKLHPHVTMVANVTMV